MKNLVFFHPFPREKQDSEKCLRLFAFAVSPLDRETGWIWNPVPGQTGVIVGHLRHTSFIICKQKEG